MTITEALAEIKTIQKRIETKEEFVRNFLFRLDSLKDPFEKDGGSEKAVSEARQAIRDLRTRVVALRRAIATANIETKVTIEGVERSIADWLIWRREISGDEERFLRTLRSRLTQVRDQVKRQQPKWPGTTGPIDDKPSDIIVNINEQELTSDEEKLVNILGQLDGQLSLKNATVALTI